MLFIKLNMKIKSGYHYSDPNANAQVIANVDKIEYYYDDAYEGYKSTISINGKEFRCSESADEISEKITLAEIADSVK